MTLEIEGVVDRGMGREESLRGSRILEADPGSFSSSNWLVRVLGTIVQSPARHMVALQSKIADGRVIRLELVGRDRNRDDALALNQTTHEFQGGAFVAPWLHQDIEHFAFRIRGAP